MLTISNEPNNKCSYSTLVAVFRMNEVALFEEIAETRRYAFDSSTEEKRSKLVLSKSM